MSMSLCRPRSGLAVLLHIPAVVAVEYGRPVSDSWPHSAVENILIKAFVQFGLHRPERLSDRGRPAKVVVVAGSPKSRQDLRPVKRSVPHHVKLFSRPQPGTHCRLLPLTEETVRVSAAEDLHGGVGQGLEPPEHSIWELSVEISNGGQVPRVTEVNEAVVTVELTEEVQSLGVLAGHVVVDPQPPPREQSRGGLGQWLEQSQEPLHKVSGVPVLLVPVTSLDCESSLYISVLASPCGDVNTRSVVAVAEHPLSRPQS